MPKRTRRTRHKLRRAKTFRLRGGAIDDALNAEGRTALYIAARDNDIAKVNELIAAGADVNKAKTSDGVSPLYIACHNGHIQVVKLLVSDSRTDVNATKKDSSTPLYIACQNGYTEIVKLLVSDSRTDVNASMTDSSTPLYVASQKGYTEIVKLLVSDSRTDVNAAMKTGTTPLYIASQNGYTEIVKLLVSDSRTNLNASRTSDGGITPLYIASHNGHTEIVKLLVSDSRTNVNATRTDSSTPMYIACQKGYTEIVKLLLSDSRTDVNAALKTGTTSLYIACKNGHTEVVKLLINHPMIDKTYAIQYLNIFTEEIKNLLLEDKSPLWSGFSKSDSERLGLLFEERIHSENLSKRPENAEGRQQEEILYSHCPVCLKYISHDEATCMYMSHNCSELKGFYHSSLFSKYKYKYKNVLGVETNREVISWCTLCGRICKGHQHYDLDSYKVKTPTLLPSGAYYESDCRKTNGGGGWPEKALRHHRLREYAKYLNTKIGKIRTKEALEKLVEEMWNAPLYRRENVLEEMEATKKFVGIKHTNFPNIRNGTNIATNVPYPNAAKAELLPIVYHEAPEGFVDPTGSDDTENVIQFRHRMTDGSINNHENPATDMISKDMMLLKIASAINSGEMDTIGPCWKPGCTALIYPQELKAVIEASAYSEDTDGVAQKEADLKTYERYRYEFNAKYRKP